MINIIHLQFAQIFLLGQTPSFNLLPSIFLSLYMYLKYFIVHVLNWYCKGHAKGVGKGAAGAAVAARIILKKKKKIEHILNILRNWKASAIACDHLWSMERQSVMASTCVYTGATWGVQIHINFSVPGVWKHYTELQIWVMHPSSLIQVQPCLDIVASIWPIFPLIPYLICFFLKFNIY